MRLTRHIRDAQKVLFLKVSQKRIAILQSNYIPWKGYFDIIGSVDEFIIYDEVQYTKNDWRNRNRIKTAAGVQWITIPVYQKSLKQKISETEVSQSNWAVKNWNTLKTNYGRAPAFKAIAPVFEEFYLKTQLTQLSEINISLIRMICRLLGIMTPITNSADYVLEGDPTERLVNLCRQCGATRYLSGPAAKNYLREALFQQNNIAVEWMDYSGYPEYPQLYPPFSHYVSILDLLFSMGEHAAQYMKFKQL
jgi:hypothetical protein